MKAETEMVLRLDPAAILADDNTRYALKKLRIEALAEDILAADGVHTPVEVELLTPAQGKFTHRLTTGHIRHAAVLSLNESGAGLTLPAIVRTTGGDAARVRRQLSENLQRENLSPMDQAVAIQRLLGVGVNKADIRKLFARPTGRKGLTNQPASASWLNMTLGLLELPRPIQDRIHDGRIGFAAAYELMRTVSPDKRQAVLDRAEEERLNAIAKEERDEDKFLHSAKAQAAIEAKAAAAQAALEKATADAAKAAEVLAAKQAAAKTAGSVAGKLAPAEAKKVADKLHKATGDVKEAEKLLADAEKAVQKLSAPKPTNAKKAAAKGARAKAPISVAEVKKAAAKEGASKVPTTTLLSAKEMRAVIAGIQVLVYPRVTAISRAILAVFDGQETAGHLHTRIAHIIQEPNRPPKPATTKKEKK